MAKSNRAIIKLISGIFLGVFLSSCSPDPIKWVAIGDSITYLNEHPDETGNRVTRGYMSRVVEAMPHISYVNKGYNGWTAGDVAGQIETLDLMKADVYSVFLGTNDWWRGGPIGTPEDYKNASGNNTFYGSYRIIVNKLRSLNPDAKIILITPMQRGDFVYINDMKNNAYGSYKDKNGQTLEVFVEAVRTISHHEKFQLVDLFHQSDLSLKNMVKFKRLKDPVTGDYRNYAYPEYIGIAFNPETDEYPYPPEAAEVTYDGLHPSDLGYAIIAESLMEVLKK